MKIINFMIDLYNYNKKLAIGTLLFLLECLMYIISMDWTEWFTHANEWYNFAYNLGLAYICSYIFFIFQSYIPNKRINMKCLNIIQPELHTLCRYLGEMVAFCDCFVTIVDNMIKVPDRDEDGMVYYKYVSKTDNERYIINESVNVIKFFEEYDIKIKKSINNIESRFVYKDCDHMLLELIARLQNNNFSKILKSMKMHIDRTNVSFSNLKEIYTEHKSIYTEIQKFDLRKTEYKMELLSKKEIKEIKDITKRFEYRMEL